MLPPPPLPVPPDTAASTTLDAFTALARAHQRAARARARAILGDDAAAEDAVQDALVDAFRNFDQLRDRAAFGAWFDRIVFKHCDRQRRRRRDTPTGDTVDATATAEASPAADAARREELARLRRAIEALPEPERVVVALHHIAGEPVARIAELLRLQVGTVKKRLFTARQRLRIDDAALLDAVDALDALDPRVELFLAIRSGDLDRTRVVLGRHPDLLEAEEGWDDDAALRGGFTLAHRLTPLVLAAGEGDLAIVELLLGAGARPDGRCGCDAGETALWAATRAGHTAVAARLRAAGAAPDATNRRGVGCADLVRWRADLAAVEDGPSAVFGVDADGAWQTGIRALDLWLPLRRGDVVRVVGAAETGLMVLLAEVAALAGRSGGRTVWTGRAAHPWQQRELETLAARSGVDPHVEVRATRDRAVESLLDGSLTRCRALRAEYRHVVHVIFENEHGAAAVDAAWAGLRDAADLTLVVRPWAAVTRGLVDVPRDDGPHDAVLCTDARLAARSLYPAIDPLRSRSVRGDGEETAEARRLVAALEALDPALASELRDAPPEQRVVAARAQRLLAFLSQPFVTATPDTGMAGFAVPRAETLEQVRRILDGALDDVPIAELRYAR